LDLLPSRYSKPQESFRLLIVGETGSGKTRLTEKILYSLANVVEHSKITVLDFAPEYGGVGRRLSTRGLGVRVLRPPRLYAPRLMGRNCGEVLEYARKNAVETRRAIEEYLKEPTPVLIANDVTLHLHAGDIEPLISAVRSSVFFAGNAYYGKRLRDDCGVWERERRLVSALIREMDVVWRL